jgi:hypothetical protein
MPASEAGLSGSTATPPRRWLVRRHLEALAEVAIQLAHGKPMRAAAQARRQRALSDCGAATIARRALRQLHRHAHRRPSRSTLSVALVPGRRAATRAIRLSLSPTASAVHGNDHVVDAQAARSPGDPAVTS